MWGFCVILPLGTSIWVVSSVLEFGVTMIFPSALIPCACGWVCFSPGACTGITRSIFVAPGASSTTLSAPLRPTWI